MYTQTANKTFFSLHLSEIDDESFNILSFEGQEKISGLFEYKIEIISKVKDLDSSVILNKPAVFSLLRGHAEPEKIHGIITHFEQRGIFDESVYYSVVLSPRLWLLNLNYQNAVFQNVDITEVIKKMVESSGLSGGDYKIVLKNSYPKNEYLVQYKETNLNFLNRRLEHYGIYYYFDHKDGEDVVVFTDSKNNLPETDPSEAIGFNMDNDPLGTKEAIREINCVEKLVTGTVQLKDYNYLFPEKQLMVRSSIDTDAPGTYYDFGDNFPDVKEAEFLAKVRNQEFISGRKIFNGLCDSRLFRAGMRFKMEKHYREDWNNEYIITKLYCRGSHNDLPEYTRLHKSVVPTFECRFEAIPFSIEFRPPRTAFIPKIPGIMSSKVESGSGDEYAFIDEQGRYRAKMLFDLGDKTNGEASLPLRLKQCYTGPGYGIHFPNHKDVELLWSCIDGDPDRPVGLGSVPNPSVASPVTSQNKTQNIIRTAAGNEIILDDKTKESQIILNTTDANNMLLDDKDDKISISTTAKHQFIMDDKNQNMTVMTKDGHLLILDDKNMKITVQSKNGHMICIDDTSGEREYNRS